MTDEYTRRGLLSLVPSIAIVSAGCTLKNTSPESQVSLSPVVENFSESDETYFMSVRVDIGVGGNWDPLRNVSLLAIDERGTEVCRKNIGYITNISNDTVVQMTCESFPHTISFELKRGPCAQNVSVQRLVWVPAEEDWSPEYIECD